MKHNGRMDKIRVRLLVFILIGYTSFSWGVGEPISENSQDELEKAKSKILHFVKQNKRNFRVEELILLDYLQRRFNLPTEFSFEQTFIRVPTKQDIESLKIYGRLVGYRGIEQRKPSSASSFVWSDIDALHIRNEDDCPPPNDIIKRLYNQAIKGDYKLTHSALAFAWYIEQGCLSKEEVEVMRLNDFLITEMLKQGRGCRFPTDVKLEAFTFVCYLGGKERLKIEELLQVIYYQRSDGAFSGTNDPYSGINVHTTLLCLWLLCEFTQQEYNSSEPMIRRR